MAKPINWQTRFYRADSSRKTWKMRYEDICKKYKELRANNEPDLIERNRNQERIIIELQEELQELKERINRVKNHFCKDEDVWKSLCFECSQNKNKAQEVK